MVTRRKLELRKSSCAKCQAQVVCAGGSDTKIVTVGYFGVAERLRKYSYFDVKCLFAIFSYPQRGERSGKKCRPIKTSLYFRFYGIVTIVSSLLWKRMLYFQVYCKHENNSLGISFLFNFLVEKIDFKMNKIKNLFLKVAC